MKKVRLMSAMLAVAAVLATGCASTSGTAALTDKNTVQAIVIQKTTKEDISRMLGAPSGQSKSSDGGEMWMYSYTSVSTLPFFSSADIRQLQVKFDKRGVVTDYTTSKNGF